MRITVALYVLALVVRLVLVFLHPDAAYPDSYYYVNVAHALYDGHGFNIDFIWCFIDVGGRLPANPTLPIPSNAHWMPLASIVQLPTIALLGPTPLASDLPFALLGSLAAPLTWLMARDFGARAAVAAGAGVMVAIPAAAAVFMAQPDNFSLYQPLGMAALWMAARGLRGDSRAFAFSGLLVGLATLARNDGVLLGAAVGLCFFWNRWRAWRQHENARSTPGATGRPIPWAAAFACFGLFVVATAPWYLRDLAVFGSISPSSASGRLLWIANYEQFDSITGDTSLTAFFGQGLGPLLTSRALGLVAAVWIYAGLICSLGLAPFAAVGTWARRRSLDFGPFFVYAGLLFAAAGLLFAVHVPYGTFLHSAVALAPHSYVLILEGVAIAVAWVARRRRTWNEPQAQRVFLGAAVCFSLVTATAFAAIAERSWDWERQLRIATRDALARAGSPTTDLLYSSDPGGYRYYTGRGGVVTPNDSLDTIRQVGQAYGVRWLVLERRHIVSPLGAVLLGQVHPAWLGPPILELDVGAPAPDGAPDLAIYPVCFSAGDTRCSGAAAK